MEFSSAWKPIRESESNQARRSGPLPDSVFSAKLNQYPADSELDLCGRVVILELFQYGEEKLYREALSEVRLLGIRHHAFRGWG